VTSVAKGNPARRRTLGLTVGACVVLLAASVVRGATAADAGRSTSPRPATEGIAQQQGTLRISIGLEDPANAEGTVTVTRPGVPEVTCPQQQCVFDYEEGDSLTLTSNPSPGAFFHRWRDERRRRPDPCAASSFEASCTLHLTGAATEVAAIFLPDPTPLAVGVTGNDASVTVTPGGECRTSQGGGDACYYAVTQGVTPGTEAKLTPNEAPGSTFVGWSVPECPGLGECRIVVDSQLRSVVATFLPTKLSIIKSNSQNGSVTSGESPPKIDCDETCSDASANYETLAEVTLKASPVGTGTFKGWSGACLEFEASPTCTIRLSGDDVVGAWFDGSDDRPEIIPPRIPVALRVNKTGDGAGTVTSTRSRFRETINCGSGPGCDAFFEQGETARLVADPAAGSTFAGWKTPGGLCSSDVNCRFDVMKVSRLEANFVKRAQPPPPPPQPQPQPPTPPRHCAVRKVGGPRADRLNGGARSDAIYGRAGNDRIRGLGGNDCLFGEGGNDQVWGGPGNDAVSGGKGSDRLYGGAGRDTMQGGPGRDRIFAVDRARDVVVCGRGRDTVRADRVDRILGCELVRRR
jgi:RTX calcium-binding nonapeptide repeat (4 copies)/Divergent InlB B-repeat domain